MPETIHSRELLQCLHSYPLAQSLLQGKREKNSREFHYLAYLSAPEFLVCSSEQL